MDWGNPKFIDWAEDIREAVTPAAHFVGYYDAHIDYDYGDIVIIDDVTYIYGDCGQWYEIGQAPSFEAPTPKKVYINCPNCGAPMHNHHCDYCGTEC